jgi:3-hydroxyacyl-CoA dehydrogenase
MLEEGVASAEDIDRAMELGYRHPMGPLRLTDLVGLDVRLGIAEYLHETLGQDHFQPPELLRRKVARESWGRSRARVSTAGTTEARTHTGGRSPPVEFETILVEKRRPPGLHHPQPARRS